MLHTHAYILVSVKNNFGTLFAKCGYSISSVTRSLPIQSKQTANCISRDKLLRRSGEKCRSNKGRVRQAYTSLLHRKATSEAAVDKPLRLYTRGAAVGSYVGETSHSQIGQNVRRGDLASWHAMSTLQWCIGTQNSELL